jgi:hypothetical protein
MEEKIFCPICNEEICCEIPDDYVGEELPPRILSPSEAMAYHTSKNHKKEDP